MEINNVIINVIIYFTIFFSPLGSAFLLLAKEKQFVRQENAKPNNTLEFKTKKREQRMHETKG